MAAHQAWATLLRMKAYRAALLYFSDPNVAQATLEQDGLLVVGPAASSRQALWTCTSITRSSM